eukprot:3088975-Rhodomonas_salina.1
MYESRRSLATSCGRASNEGQHIEGHANEDYPEGCRAGRRDSEAQSHLHHQMHVLAPTPEKDSSVVDASVPAEISYLPLKDADSVFEEILAEHGVSAKKAEALSESQIEEERESLLSTEEKLWQQHVTFPVPGQAHFSQPPPLS